MIRSLRNQLLNWLSLKYRYTKRFQRMKQTAESKIEIPLPLIIQICTAFPSSSLHCEVRLSNAPPPLQKHRVVRAEEDLRVTCQTLSSQSQLQISDGNCFVAHLIFNQPDFQER